MTPPRPLGDAAALLILAGAKAAEMARLVLPRSAKAKVKEFLAGRRRRPITARAAAPEPLPADAPLAAVVIPCRDYGRYLAEAVAAARGQTLRAIEVIVVDYRSTDPATLEALAAAEAAGVRVLRTAAAGVEEARNAGIAATNARYVCCLDADDLLVPDYLEKCCAALEADGGIGFAYGWVRVFGDRDEIWRTEDFDLDRAVRYNHVPCAAVFRKEAWAAVGGYDPRMEGGYEDWEFWIRLGAAGWRGVAIPEPSFLHRRHGRTMTHAAIDRDAELCARIRALNPRVFADRAFRRAVKRGLGRVAYDEPFGNLHAAGALAAPGPEEGVLVILPWLAVGGAETVMLSILQGLAPGRRIHIVTTNPSDNPMHDAFAAVAASIHHLPGMLAPEDRDGYVLSLCRAHRLTTTLMSGSDHGYALAPALKRAVPGMRVVDLLHNDDPAAHIHTSIAAGAAIDLRVGVNERIRAALLRASFPEDGVAVILNGIDADGAFEPARIDRGAARRALGIPADRFVVTLPARLSPEKRPLAFLRAAARTTAPGLHFVMAGDGCLARAARLMIRATGLGPRVTWLGARDPAEMPAVYAASDLVILTSAIEGLPMSILEALAMGVPVISTDVGQVGAAIADGENGFVIPADGLAALPGLIDRLAADPELHARLAAAARPGLIARGLTAPAMRAAWNRLIARPSSESKAPISPSEHATELP